MVLEEGSYGLTDILHEVQVTYQKKQTRDTLRIRDHQAASEEALFSLYFMKTDAVKTLIEKTAAVVYGCHTEYPGSRSTFRSEN